MSLFFHVKKEKTQDDVHSGWGPPYLRNATLQVERPDGSWQNHINLQKHQSTR